MILKNPNNKIQIPNKYQMSNLKRDGANLHLNNFDCYYRDIKTLNLAAHSV